MDIPIWEKMSPEEQDLYLTLLWMDGHSEGSIAEFFSTTKGRIVRRRQTTLKLPTEGRPTSKPKVNPQRFRDLLDIEAMDKLEENGISSIAPPASKPPIPEEPAIQEQSPQVEPPSKIEPALSCKWPLPDTTTLKPKLCGKPVVEGHNLCEEHLAFVLKHSKI